MCAASTSGAVDYLPKPFGTNELLARIRTQLRGQARAEAPALAAPALADLPAPMTGPTTPLAPPAPRRRGAVAPGDEDEQVFISYGEEGRIYARRSARPPPRS